MSHLALMANSKTPLSKQVVLNMTYEVTHVLFRQHTFSCSSCILLHTPQMHHDSSFSGSGGSDCGPLALAIKSLAFSKLPRPWLSTRIRSVSLWSSDKVLTKSYQIGQKQFSLKILFHYWRPINFTSKLVFLHNSWTPFIWAYLYFILGLLYSSLMSCICTGVSIYGLNFNGPVFTRLLRPTRATCWTFSVGISARAAYRPRSSLSAARCFAAANLT